MKSIPLAISALFSILLPPAISQEAKIRAGDALKITIRGVPVEMLDLVGGLYKIDASGHLVGLPFIEQIRLQAGGLTEKQLSETITAAYKAAEIFTNASVTAMVPSCSSSRKISFERKPVEMLGNMTAFDAYSFAGGAARFGPSKRIFLIRPEAKNRLLNMEVDADKKVLLLPNDTLEIDKKQAFEP